MASFIQDISSIDFIKEPSNDRTDLAYRNITLNEKTLKNKGFYNGKLLICQSYKLEEKKLTVECSSLNFFDLMLKKFNKKPYPLIISTNGIVEVEKDNIILMKRDSTVYSYKNFWDFPAGLVPFDEHPLDRLKKRIIYEIGIEEKHLISDVNPLFIEMQKEPLGGYFAFYYLIKCNLRKNEVEKRFTKNDIKKVIINKKEIPNFLSKNKKVYPKNVLNKLIN